MNPSQSNPTHGASTPQCRATAYPTELRLAELALIDQRRAKASVDTYAPVVGFALSGGGIRSATFCLGLFQALAQQKLVRRIDVLSTVSGGGYFGSFIGAAFSREDGSPESVERELADNHSWTVSWLRENGRFLSPNGSGDNWQAAAVALRNWVTLHVVMLTFGMLVLGLAALVRADLGTAMITRDTWLPIERFFWKNQSAHIWCSPWLILPALSFGLVMLPSGIVYWLTQVLPVMDAVRRTAGLFSKRCTAMTNSEFASRAQVNLSRVFMVGLVSTVLLLVFAAVDSVGQTTYLVWSERDFSFPAAWTTLTGAGAIAFGFGSRIAVYIERIIGKRRFQIPFSFVALLLSFTWLSLIVFALSVIACGFGWNWEFAASDSGKLHPMSGGWKLMLTVAISFTASWIFSRSFGFVNLSSMQQTYAARLARAYLGATNPERQRSANHDMTDLIPGDDIALDDYAPHANGGPLHLINVTVNETLSGKTQIERRDRKGLAMSVGPSGLSVGPDSHALWSSAPAYRSRLARLQALWETRHRAITPIECEGNRFHSLCTEPGSKSRDSHHHIEALALGRWTAISGAAFTTGTGATTALGLSLLLGLGNVRLGYWWNSGVHPEDKPANRRSNFLETGSRLLSRVLPVQTCLLNEFLARFHGPARQHWYLSDGGHFENTGCYELVRRRVPFIVCSDAGQDPTYQFADLANLIRKSRTDFGAEIQIVRRASDTASDDPGVRFPMPKLEQVVHPSLLDVIGVPEDFTSLTGEDDENKTADRSHFSKRHAVLARIHYVDCDEFGWLLVLKPSLMGDEAMDVTQYQRTRPLFPQEPTTDQYFDEAQWESYRKLGEHIGIELFTPPTGASHKTGATWSPSQLCPPKPVPMPFAVPAQSSRSAIANN
jgi:hypothetical protein